MGYRQYIDKVLTAIGSGLRPDTYELIALAASEFWQVARRYDPHPALADQRNKTIRVGIRDNRGPQYSRALRQSQSGLARPLVRQ
jgi:hypothetical protein